MRSNRTVWRIVSIVSLLIAVGCLGFAAWYHYSNYIAEKRHETLVAEVADDTSGQETAQQEDGRQDAAQQEAQPSRTYTLEEIEAAEFTGEREGEAPVIPEDVLNAAGENPIDFDKLRAYNPELYAWIRIPGTAIDYPVAQHSGDPLYYLHHDLYGNAQFSGCIYSEEPSAKDFSDPVTILFGHNMKNGSMFQNLHLFRDEAFFEEHPYCYVYTPEKTLLYEIYSVYEFDDRPLATSYNLYGTHSQGSTDTETEADIGTTDGGNTAAEAAADTANGADTTAAAATANGTGTEAAGTNEAASSDGTAGANAPLVNGKINTLKDYLEGTMNPRSMEARVRREIRVTEEDHILTLSTCIAGAPSSRLLVQAVLAHDTDIQ